MIVVSCEIARTFRALAKKCLAGRPRGPAPFVTLQVRDGLLRIWCRIESVGLQGCIAAPGAAKDLIVAPMDVLAAIEGSRAEAVELVVDGKLRGTAAWSDHGETKSHAFEAVPPGKQHAIPGRPAQAPMPDAFRTALHECSRTANRGGEPSALHHVQIRGSGDVIGTDSKQLLVWGGFVFPFPNDVLVPAIPVFGSRELTESGSPVIGRTDSEVVVTSGVWSVFLPICEGKYPDARSILPKTGSCTEVTFDDAQAAELLRALSLLPGAAAEDRPVTLDLAESLTIRARDESTGAVQELKLAAAVTGPAVAVAVNRSAMDRSLRLGCRTIRIPPSTRLVAVEGPDRVFAVAVLDSSATVARPESSSPRFRGLRGISHERTSPVKSHDTNGSPNGRHDPPTEDAVDPLTEAEALRTAIVEAGSRLARLIAALRSSRKEKKVLANVWAGLKQLNLGGGGP